MLFLLLCSLNGIRQVDSFKHVHIMKSSGPMSVQILWVDGQKSPSFVEKSIMLQAALYCGTENYKNNTFQSLCRDYKLQWQVESQNGMHRLGLTFSHLQKERAIELLRQVLQHTTYANKDWEVWRKEQLYHYEYYRFDSDSLMKWWITGRRDFYEALEVMAMPRDGSTLMEALGKPAIISTIGNTVATYFEKELGSFISTTRVEIGSKDVQEFTKTLEGTSSSGYTALKVTGVNPLESYALYVQITEQNKDVIKLTNYNWVTSTGWITFHKKTSKEQIDLAKDLQVEFPFSQKTLLNFDLWIEFNKNKALTNAYETLEIWQEPIAQNPENRRSILIWYELLPKSKG